MSRVGNAVRRVPPVLWVIVVLMAFFSIVSGRYLSPRNLVIILQQGSVLLVISAAATFIILSGGIDLSLGAVLTLSGVIAAIALNAGFPVPIAMLIGAVAGAACGAVTGTLVALAGMESFIATLGMQGLLFGISLVLTNKEGIQVSNDSFVFLGDLVGHYVPMAAISCGIVFVAAVLVQNHTRFGRFVYAIGGNSEGARLSGVNTRFWRWMVYTFAGFLSGLGGVILVARLEVADPIVGVGWEFEAIAATLLGGTSLDIGRGDVRGTLIGVLLITVLRNGLNVIRVPSIWQPAITGTVIILAIVFQIWISTRELRKK